MLRMLKRFVVNILRGLNPTTRIFIASKLTLCGLRYISLAQEIAPEIKGAGMGTIPEGQCSKCKAPLGRGGKCPRLCEPVEVTQAYVGPAVIGGTHIGNIARSGDAGWIG